MRLDHGLEPGSTGGHGPVRYSVDHHTPGREVEFRFDPSMGLLGFHRFQIEPLDNAVRVSHTILARPTGWMHLGWPLAVRWLHDALIEDAFDQLAAEPAQQRWSLWVRVLRKVLR
jgi:hypothetical protein